MWRNMLRTAAATAAYGLIHSALASRTAKRAATDLLGERNVSTELRARERASVDGARMSPIISELLPLGVATGKIVTVEEQVEQVRADLRRGEVDRLEERTSYVYRRAGEPCRVCGSRIRTKVVAGRNLFWCGRCQRRR